MLVSYQPVKVEVPVQIDPKAVLFLQASPMFQEYSLHFISLFIQQELIQSFLFLFIAPQQQEVKEFIQPEELQWEQFQ